MRSRASFSNLGERMIRHEDRDGTGRVETDTASLIMFRHTCQYGTCRADKVTA
jgi:hypothetical protein